MKYLMLFSLMTITALISFGQASKSDSLVVVYTKYELTEQEVPLMGKQKIIIGTVNINNGSKEIASHDFLVPIMKEKISHIAVLDSNGQKIWPRIHYVADENSFTYYEGTEKEGKIKAIKSDNQKEIVLFGLQIWAKLTYDK